MRRLAQPVQNRHGRFKSSQPPSDIHDQEDQQMSMSIASAPDAALRPAAAAPAPTENGIAATKKALDHQQLQGREAVNLIEESAVPPPPTDSTKGTHVSRVA